MSPSVSPATPPRGHVLLRALTTWTAKDWIEAGGLLGFIVLMHVVGFGVLILVVAPQHYSLGTQVFSVGLGITAYTFGLRHAFDADHIAAIDNTTRKLRNDGIRPKSVGFWFAMGHSTIVFGMAALVAVGAHAVGALVDDDSSAHRTIGTVGTLSSGSFLYLIGILNLVALVGIWRVWQGLRHGEFDESELEEHLSNRGLFARFLNGLTRAIRKPWQAYPVGVLFGLGFDTATEITLMVLAGSGAAAGVPWYAILVLPLLFAAGMSLLDCLDGLFMSIAYDWAFLKPVRKVYYNLAITALSVTVALLIGTIELVGVLDGNLGWSNPVTDWISDIDLNNVGFIIVGLFVAIWAAAIAYWNIAKVEDRWGHVGVAVGSAED
ncbi:HoxN/HupN/NixA family nickel/cobalt transporter [Nocardioides sp. BP30]|uniref:HoxN/HupN/NixA family nickel/cobalt transporter n=1 Tax=Nocardioides sp. BP30 TaxID=3036374 RepID=UPI0024692CB3|nr:HoxN/HupN/NixA family nickel/cobalt transporter [Nocardioides sp. BP30]WGL51268.1 HoxN/HupN/NixA family nickel/cobalt transporter [Nocardioides sp. BP30]